MFDKIAAIKRLRELTSKLTVITTGEIKLVDGVITIGPVTISPLGLKDAKDFVEYVMAGVAAAPVVNSVWELHRISVMDGGQMLDHPVRIGIFRTEAGAMGIRDNIMRRKSYNEVYETAYDFTITEVSFGQR